MNWKNLSAGEPGKIQISHSISESATLVFILLTILLAGCIPRWDDMPPPDIEGKDIMKGVSEFIATNGWAMSTNTGELYFNDHEAKLIHNLPWRKFKNKQFPAWTQSGILYVISNPGWHDDYGGVAYNPNTNKFSTDIECFKQIGSHWYVWWTTDTPNPNDKDKPTIYG
jgi:hypothetical protein